MCIPHIRVGSKKNKRVGSYAHELEGGMSAQIVWNSSTWEISPLVGFFSFFKDVIYLFERERRDKAWTRGAEGEGEAGSLLNREPALGPGSWSEPKAEG